MENYSEEDSRQIETRLQITPGERNVKRIQTYRGGCSLPLILQARVTKQEMPLKPS
jgi:hypothetical protein